MQDLQVLKELLVPKELLDLQVEQDLLVLKDIKVLVVRLGLKVLKDIKDCKVLRHTSAHLPPQVELLLEICGGKVTQEI